MTTEFEIEDITDAYVHYPKEALIPPFKFALVKDLDGDNG
jgi:hypothetical protein